MSRPPSADVVVIGAGSLGLGLAVRAAQRGLVVACLGRQGPLARAALGEDAVDLARAEHAPIAIVTVKAHDLDGALAAVGAPSRVIVVSNGLPQTPSPVCLALAWACASRAGDGRAIWRGPVRLVASAGPAGDALADVFAGSADVAVTLEPVARMDALRYEKLLVSAGLNAVAALHRVAPRAVLADPILLRRACDVAGEIAALAELRGHLVPAPDDVVRRAAEAMGDFEPSMLQDRRRGAPMELDAVLGAPLRALTAHDLPRRAVASLLTDLSRS